jgi:glycerol-3-phosphate dehydrogenase (NAD(P)+)
VATNSLEELANSCTLIFPIIPSSNFKEMIVSLSPYLSPKHILIHGTKGLHIDQDINNIDSLSKEDVYTMSELILKETSVVRVGCMAGPNLATEIAQGQLGATVIASRYNEVIKEGQKAINSNVFRAFGSNETIGVELAGVLKNYIAIASGMLNELGYGDNTKALLITRGMAEMIYIGKALGASEKAFLGIAGVGDLMATCNSKLSRNFRVGYNLAKGKKLEDIVEEIGEVAEGIKTLQIIKLLDKYEFNAPIAEALHRIIFEDWSIKKGVAYLMSRPVSFDADYVE